MRCRFKVAQCTSVHDASAAFNPAYAFFFSFHSTPFSALREGQRPRDLLFFAGEIILPLILHAYAYASSTACINTVAQSFSDRLDTSIYHLGMCVRVYVHLSGSTCLNTRTHYYMITNVLVDGVIERTHTHNRC